jgi:alkylation response protein AidB-like acyl-CoA dehydrogenase
MTQGSPPPGRRGPGTVDAARVEDTIGDRPRLVPLFDDEHHAFRSTIRVASKAFAGDVADWERAGHLPRAPFAALGAAGVFQERWAAGPAGGLRHGVVLAEEAARISAGFGLAMTVHAEVFCGLLLRLARSEGQRAVLADALEGRAVGCFAVTEPRGGSDVQGAVTTLRRVDGGWRLEGEKRFISNAGSATHAVVLVGAPTEQPQGRRRTSLALVPLDAPGVHVTGFYPKAGTPECDAAHIEFDAVLGEDALLGPEGLGAVYAMRALVLERIAVSAQLLVAARTSLRLAAAYMRRRHQFGQRLLDHQALRHRFADATAKTWSAEAMLAGVVAAMAAGRNVTPEAAATKLLCAEAAQLATDESLQFVGGRGYTANYPFERMWRDVRLARIGAGTDEIMRELIAEAVDRSDPSYESLLDDYVEADVPTADPTSVGAHHPHNGGS